MRKMCIRDMGRRSGKLNIAIISSFLLFVFFTFPSAWSLQYPWLPRQTEDLPIIRDIPVPVGFVRVSCSPQSFAWWLRHLPLKTENNQVYLFNGRLKRNQEAHYRVIAMDVGKRDLQQCADAVIRLRAEYLYFSKRFQDIHFDFTSGDRADFQMWAQGYRPVVNGNRVDWKKRYFRPEPDFSYRNFRAYLNTVFTYAGSYSLSKELVPVREANDIRIGDVLIQGGFPGHAVIVVDLCVNPETGQKLILLAQSYMPAQEIHILKNPTHHEISPWYIVKKSGSLITPEWRFDWSDLKRFR